MFSISEALLKAADAALIVVTLAVEAVSFALSLAAAIASFICSLALWAPFSNNIFFINLKLIYLPILVPIERSSI